MHKSNKLYLRLRKIVGSLFFIRYFTAMETKLNRLDLKLRIFTYFNEHPTEKENYKAELSFLSQAQEDINLIFPYKKQKELQTTEAYLDTKLKLPYVIHKEKRLYFPENWSVEAANGSYRNFIENENMLGGNYLEKSPHQYESETFYVKEGDILIDAGCAEALFSLDAIDKIKKLYLIESDPAWLEPLKATFAPYKDKVILIDKLLADRDDKQTVTLSSIFQENPNSSFFIKMDIEGYETTVIRDSLSALKQYEGNLKLACCTYHKQADAQELSEMFKSINFDLEYSDGYMLFIYDELTPPFFRKGMIRARKK